MFEFLKKKKSIQPNDIKGLWLGYFKNDHINWNTKFPFSMDIVKVQSSHENNIIKIEGFILDKHNKLTSDFYGSIDLKKNSLEFVKKYSKLAAERIDYSKGTVDTEFYDFDFYVKYHGKLVKRGKRMKGKWKVSDDTIIRFHQDEYLREKSIRLPEDSGKWEAVKIHSKTSNE
ncbi:hypothetical protein [Kordia sp.]|uniref:hypothetical protein n=1 Tax=Kordia sp. TaxID=1965332 RepID=UPI0025BE756A|nr:hypothetical protein [Kordia sp.]MCH2194858.1 hypothetical protein [Kordia sp.]